MGMLMLEKHVEDNSVTNTLLMNKENCALKLVDEIILYYDSRSKKHKKVDMELPLSTYVYMYVCT